MVVLINFPHFVGCPQQIIVARQPLICGPVVPIPLIIGTSNLKVDHLAMHSYDNRTRTELLPTVTCLNVMFSIFQVTKAAPPEEDQEGSGTPLRDEAGTPTLDEAPVDDDPPTPLADEPADNPEVDPWSLIPMDDELSDDDFAPYVPPTPSTPTKDEPPPPGTEEELPKPQVNQPLANNSVPVQSAVPVPQNTQPVAPNVVMMQQPYAQYSGVPNPMVYPTQPVQNYSYTAQGTYYMPQQQVQQAAPTLAQPVTTEESNQIQTLSTVTGHRPRDNYYRGSSSSSSSSSYQHRDNYYNRDRGGDDYRRRYRDEDDDRRYRGDRNRERERDGDRRDRGYDRRW